jgi:Zn-finger nucleic acid-binding protein
MFRCPNCGGAVDEAERRCGYCRAPVATVRCGRCYHMSIPDAVHCAGCGAVLGLEPVGEPDYLKCPRCLVDLEVFRGGSGKLRDCGHCGGQFVEHVLLRDLIERRELYGSVAPRAFRKRNPLTQPVHYVPCPECRTLMTRRNFGGASGVVVDICAPHGIWFDIGELPAVLSFVESGGLASARRRELEEAERKRRDSQVTFTSPAVSGSALSSGETEDFVMSAAGALLDFLTNL